MATAVICGRFRRGCILVKRDGRLGRKLKLWTTNRGMPPVRLRGRGCLGWCFELRWLQVCGFMEKINSFPDQFPLWQWLSCLALQIQFSNDPASRHLSRCSEPFLTYSCLRYSMTNAQRAGPKHIICMLRGDTAAGSRSQRYGPCMPLLGIGCLYPFSPDLRRLPESARWLRQPSMGLCMERRSLR